ncbi:LOW QUALITY PROTEIN: zinc fingers and homeoboxes protein 2-like [Denticeps clupeoides]|uniref:LOW QUALITY PROTEIN: zinc fingers and homeoboxes protein 2-like n=1 Tax=Denticeps clupeoides TaxID=299321 RepID=UPI0010A39B09|nr:LOW QUALITY PROTEIN: zinc fingers and homeoboxes protein 2-like [Denticeps clupeoides]
MSSRRKTSTPCMIRLVSETLEEDGLKPFEVPAEEPPQDSSSQAFASQDCPSASDATEDQSCKPKEKKEADEGKELKPQKQNQGGYACKYCSFSTQNLSTFKGHVDSTHPNVILNPLYLCAVCNFSTKKFDSLSEHNELHHPGVGNFKFKRIKSNNQTILEQTIEGEDISTDLNEDKNPRHPMFPLRTERNEKQNTEDAFGDGIDLGNRFENQITAINVNGMVIIPDPMVLQGLSHVMPLLQRPPNFSSVPKIAVPLNTTKYNPLLDSNSILITSFNKFPYPTHAELSWLTAASKHPEEQIKVWFTTQRLKQGITWSPEEVEEARKKMFNGSIPPVHHTFTVLPTSVLASQPIKSVPPITEMIPGHGHTSSSQLLLTSASRISNSVTVTTVSHVQSLKRPLATPSMPTEAKRPLMPPTDDPKEKLPMAPPPVPPKDRLQMAPPPVPLEIKRPMAPPYVASEMKRPVATPIVSLRGKLHTALPFSGTKDKLPMLPPLLNPKERPLVSTETKRSAVVPQIRSHTPSAPEVSKDKLSKLLTLLPSDLKLPVVPPMVAPQVKRPTIIQTARTITKALPSVPAFPLEYQQPKEQTENQKVISAENHILDRKEVNGVSQDGKNRFSDQGFQTHNGSMSLNADLVPKERPKKVPSQFPLLERVKGKTTEQLKILEESFQRNSFPMYSEVDNLVSATRLSREEIESWFHERRALRDNLEQALLNSMGAKRMETMEKRQQQHLTLNGGHKQRYLSISPLRPIVAPSTSPLHLDGKSLGLLKEVFLQTRWPSPDEYNQLERQTGLSRTDIVRWFKDSRLALKSGNLGWTELNSKSHGSGLNVQGLPLSMESAGSILRYSQEFHSSRVEDNLGLRDCAKPSQEIKDWFANKIIQNMSDISKNVCQNGGSREDCGNWAAEPVGRNIGGRSQELVSDTD